MTRPGEHDDFRHLSELQDLVAEAADADVAKLLGDLDGLSLNDWASRTIAAAENAGRGDIAAETRELLKRVDEAQAKLDAATLRRQDTAARARGHLGS